MKKDNKYLLFAHGGSQNHGCEAIVRATTKLLGLNPDNATLLSKSATQDSQYGINNLLTLKQMQSKFDDTMLYKVRHAIARDKDAVYYHNLYKGMTNACKGYDLALSIGGDNYCYQGIASEMMVMHSLVRKAVKKTVLWGCSVESDTLSSALINDLKSYTLIATRESITFDSLAHRGIKNIIIAPDPAFALNRKDLPLPDGFKSGNTIGINLSPLVLEKESSKGIVMANYRRLIEHIIKTTDMQIALISHVVWRSNDDRKPLTELFQQYSPTGRIIMISDHNAEELKGFIARCRFMIAARTHASIAAYSEQVPTLVMGYSIKARGIAKDIFGTYDHYVKPVQGLLSEDDLIGSVQWLMENEQSIRSHYSRIMPRYIAQTAKLRSFIENL